MQNIPSLRRSTKIHEVCREFNLIEPFRTRNPNKREYTFIPSGINENNRSRLDFFLISTELYNQETLVTTPHSLNSTMFDHKSVSMFLKKKKFIQRNIIKDTVLNNPDLDAHVKCAVFECYLQHWEPPGAAVSGLSFGCRLHLDGTESHWMSASSSRTERSGDPGSIEGCRSSKMDPGSAPLRGLSGMTVRFRALLRTGPAPAPSSCRRRRWCGRDVRPSPAGSAPYKSGPWSDENAQWIIWKWVIFRWVMLRSITLSIWV